MVAHVQVFRHHRDMAADQLGDLQIVMAVGVRLLPIHRQRAQALATGVQRKASQRTGAEGGNSRRPPGPAAAGRQVSTRDSSGTSVHGRAFGVVALQVVGDADELVVGGRGQHLALDSETTDADKRSIADIPVITCHFRSALHPAVLTHERGAVKRLLGVSCAGRCPSRWLGPG